MARKLKLKAAFMLALAKINLAALLVFETACGRLGYEHVKARAPSLDASSATDVDSSGADNLDSDSRVDVLQTARVETAAGSPPGGSGTGSGLAQDAQLLSVRGVAVSADGTVYFSDESERIRALNPKDGVVSTIAGTGVAGYLDGPAAKAQLNGATGLDVSPDGTLYIADAGNDRIRVLNGTVLTTLAGGRGFADGPPNQVLFSGPTWLVRGPTGFLVVVDKLNHAIREVSPAGDTRTITGGTFGYVNGPLGNALFCDPDGVALDKVERIIVLDRLCSTVRRVDKTMVEDVAGKNSLDGSTDGPGLSARFYFPGGVASGPLGEIYVADTRNHTIRRIEGNVVSTIAGSGFPGSEDGIGRAAQFLHPTDIKFDVGRKALLIADSGNHRLRLFDLASSRVSTLIGHGTSGRIDGAGIVARFSEPRGMATDKAGLVYIADSLNHVVRTFDPKTSKVGTFAGSGTRGYRDGPARTAMFNEVWGLTVRPDGEVIVVDKENGCLRSIKDGMVTTLAATPRFAFNDPVGIVVGADGSLVVSEQESHRLYLVSADGARRVVLAGSGMAGAQDGVGVNAQFNLPGGLALDVDGTIIVADGGNNKLRRVTLTGMVTSIVGNQRGTIDGPIATASLNHPRAVALDTNGDILVGEETQMRRISGGVVTTVAGGPDLGSIDGDGWQARFFQIEGLTVQADGSFLVSDTRNHALRRITF